MDNTAEETNIRMHIHKDLKLSLIKEIQAEIHENNQNTKGSKANNFSGNKQRIATVINGDSRAPWMV